MKNFIKNPNRINVLSLIFVVLFISSSCNNLDKSKEEDENKKAFNMEKERKELQKTVIAFRAALTKKDAKAAASFYTVDAVFMPNNAPISIGRDNIEQALAGFIKSGFTELDVESTWIEGCGEYLLDTEKWTLSNGEVTIIGKSLVVWKKEDGIWKMYKDMINTDTP